VLVDEAVCAVRPGVEQRRRTSGLAHVLPERRAGLIQVAEDARHVMVITDANGVLAVAERGINAVGGANAAAGVSPKR
jgi:hypothetical protein